MSVLELHTYERVFSIAFDWQIRLHNENQQTSEVKLMHQLLTIILNIAFTKMIFPTNLH